MLNVENRQSWVFIAHSLAEDIRVDSLRDLEWAHPLLFQFLACALRINPIQGMRVHENLVPLLKVRYGPPSFVELSDLFILHSHDRSASAVPIHREGLEEIHRVRRKGVGRIARSCRAFRNQKVKGRLRLETVD